MVGLLISAARLPIKDTGHPGTVGKQNQTASIYYGVHVPGWLNTLSAVNAFERNANKAVAIVMWYQGWGVSDNTRYFQSAWMNNVRNHGAIPMVSWEPWNYTQGVNQPAFSLQNIINGRYDAYITQWAQASKAWGHPYFLRFAAEMNGDWYPWSEQVNGNHAGQYVLAWRHVHDIFTSVGATNATWVWSPNVEYNRSTPLAGLYPGSAYVDWAGMDGYNWSTLQGHSWQTFSQVFQQTYNDLLGMLPGKPLMIAETASADIGGNKAAWITDAFANQLPNFFPAIRAVIWFDENKETDWRIESSPAARTAFAHAIASPVYASNSFANLSATRIPTLNTNLGQHR
jgi:beta-mannanase